MDQTTELENILQCPLSGERLSYKSINDSSLKALAPADNQVEFGFENEAATAFYPMIDNIVCLLPEYAFTEITEKSHRETAAVQAFYDESGWKKNEEDRYIDNKLFVDQRSIADEYRLESTRRVNRFFEGGKYLLDIASGPVYQPEYQEFSEPFECRICIDISIRALKEAQQNLAGQKAFFILGDITRIPLRSGICDGVVSMHTLYHVPKERQALGVNEMVRVCKEGRNVVIAYNWGWHSMLMNIALFPSRLIRLIKRLTKSLGKKEDNSTVQSLYFYSHSRSYFRKNTPKEAELQFYIQKSLHENFIKLYLGENVRSKSFLKWLFKQEDKHPHFFGKHGAFPLLVFRKSGK